MSGQQFWIYAVVWLGMIAATALAANGRGRNPARWAVYGALVGVFALITVLILAPEYPSGVAQQDTVRPGMGRTIGTREIVALAGAGVLGIGAFSPVLSAPFVGEITYFNNGKGDGVIVALLALSAALGVLVFRSARLAWGPAIVAAGIAAYDLENIQDRIAHLPNGLAQAMIQVQYGWALIFCGAIMLVATAFMPGPELTRRPQGYPGPDGTPEGPVPPLQAPPPTVVPPHVQPSAPARQEIITGHQERSWPWWPVIAAVVGVITIGMLVIGAADGYYGPWASHAAASSENPRPNAPAVVPAVATSTPTALPVTAPTVALPVRADLSDALHAYQHAIREVYGPSHSVSMLGEVATGRAARAVWCVTAGKTNSLVNTRSYYTYSGTQDDFQPAGYTGNTATVRVHISQRIATHHADGTTSGYDAGYTMTFTLVNTGFAWKVSDYSWVGDDGSQGSATEDAQPCA